MYDGNRSFGTRRYDRIYNNFNNISKHSYGFAERYHIIQIMITLINVCDDNIYTSRRQRNHFFVWEVKNYPLRSTNVGVEDMRIKNMEFDGAKKYDV